MASAPQVLAGIARAGPMASRGSPPPGTPGGDGAVGEHPIGIINPRDGIIQ